MHQNANSYTTDVATQQDYEKINGKEIQSSQQERDLKDLIQDLEWDAHVSKVSNQTKPHPCNDNKKLRE